MRFRLVVDESNRPVLTGGCCSVVIVKAGLTVIKKINFYSKDDLWQAFTEAGHQQKTLGLSLDIKEIMQTWTNQVNYFYSKLLEGPNGFSI